MSTSQTQRRRRKRNRKIKDLRRKLRRQAARRRPPTATPAPAMRVKITSLSGLNVEAIRKLGMTVIEHKKTVIVLGHARDHVITCVREGMARPELADSLRSVLRKLDNLESPHVIEGVA